MKSKQVIAACGAVVLISGTANTQEEPDPVVGAFLTNYVVEVIDGTPCEDLVQGGFVDTCESSQTSLLTSDGTVLTQDNNASRLARSDAVGTWRPAAAEQRYRTRAVTIYYDENSRVSGYDVTTSRFRLSNNGRRSSGTFEVRNYSAEQDPLDQNETPQFINTGTLESRRIR